MNNIVKNKKFLKDLWRPLPGRDFEIDRFSHIRLDFNECADMNLVKFFYRETINRLKAEHFSVYPEIESLYEKLAQELNLPISYIFLSAGSDISIRSVFETFINPGDKVVLFDPTFVMYSVYCKLFKSKDVKISYDKNLTIPVDKIYKAINNDPVLLIITNPDNPTGSIIDEHELKKIISFAHKRGVIVLIDEAYFPYYPLTVIDWVKEFDNLIVTRTFSKAYGLAGLRLGYSVGNPDIMRLFHAQKPMYEISMLGVIAGLTALDNTDRVINSVKKIKKLKDYFSNELVKVGFRVKRGYANFILVDFGSKKKKIFRRLKKNKILIKESLEHHVLKSFSRVSIGSQKIIKFFLDVIKDI